jgi:hypothetical protein
MAQRKLALTMAAQPGLFGAPPGLPEGFRYQDDLLSPDEADALVAKVSELTFKPFEFHGYLGNRRIAAFGWRYDYAARRLGEAAPCRTSCSPWREGPLRSPAGRRTPFSRPW